MDITTSLSRILARMKIELPTDRPPAFADPKRQRFPRGGIHLVLNGAKATMQPRRGDPIECKQAVTLNLGRTYRGAEKVDGRAATRRRRQMEKRAT